MTHSVRDFSVLSRPCSLVVFLSAVHLLVALYYVLYSPETLSFLPYFKEAFSNTGLPTNRSRNDGMFVTSAQSKEPSPDETTSLPSAAPQSCPETPPRLVGPHHVEFSNPVSLELVRKENPEIQEGGRWRPKDCTARQKVAIIIPYRHRKTHLKYWLYYLHPILQRQQLDYGVYVVNQYGETTFNRAKLMNVGFTEALKQYDYDCFVFSDVDIVPADDRNLYKCYNQPRHLSVALDKFGFRLPYERIFGGASAMNKEQFTKINGYPNNYWGWGGEDDDVSNRLSIRGLSISRPDSIIGRCRMITHTEDTNNAPNPKRFDQIKHTRETIDRDGLSSLQYRLVSVEKCPLYTNVTVDVGTP
ncbi:beta-1,4-galactosyltransferase 1-like [Clupea harengus]|uniref:Beta-1,4-galactosyltransferase n=1 Tax=Clupea harengus TaxID=7950 RepID=A0A6P8F445_CLUHA|nr:beta-1,4-galactosyltransferase 1-like [Clupea harengus]